MPGSALALLGGQIAYALLGLRRDRLAVFFAVVFPALLLVLFPTAGWTALALLVAWRRGTVER